ncbi:hypothetical protein HYU11_04280 [Candidatus Woesearchaeota archaeon]|nr:hypothetical protein [Candidatus Woesearchaeota archaeon]
MNISRDTPLSELTLRKYEKPMNLKERELIKKVCLTIGMLQPGDSRDVMVDVLQVLLRSKKKRKALSATEIEKKVIENRKKHKLQLTGIASSNIRRQLKRLKDLFIIEKVLNKYRITEFMSLNEIYDQKIEKFVLQSIVQRAKEYFAKTDELADSRR